MTSELSEQVTKPYKYWETLCKFMNVIFFYYEQNLVSFMIGVYKCNKLKPAVSVALK